MVWNSVTINTQGNEEKRINFKVIIFNLKHPKRGIEGKDVSKWKSVLWSDESKFDLLVGNYGRRVLWAKEERDLPACHQHSVQKPAFLLVWGYISAYGMGSLHVLEGTMIDEGLVYFSSTMQNHILQLLKWHGFVVEESGC